MKSRYKYEVAEACGVTRNTLNRWCKMHEKELAKRGQRVNSKMFTPQAMQYICKVFVLSESDFRQS